MTASKTDAIAIMKLTTAGKSYAIAITRLMTASKTDAIAIMKLTTASKSYAIAIVKLMTASKTDAIAIMKLMTASKGYAIAIMKLTTASKTDAIAIMKLMTASKSYAIAIMQLTTASKGYAIAIMKLMTASKGYAIVIHELATTIAVGGPRGSIAPVTNARLMTSLVTFTIAGLRRSSALLSLRTAKGRQAPRGCSPCDAITAWATQRSSEGPLDDDALVATAKAMLLGKCLRSGRGGSGPRVNRALRVASGRALTSRCPGSRRRGPCCRPSE
jgi:hypothetical protein